MAKRQAAFTRLPPRASRSTIWGLTLVTTAIAVLLAAVAYVGSTGLTQRQVAGTRRVLNSLAAEGALLEQHWRSGGLPATVLSTEQENISEESSANEKQLSQLEDQSHG